MIPKTLLTMRTWLLKIWRFYIDGFKSMTIGRVLWLIILVKLFIMFAILRIFFFPNYLNDSLVEPLDNAILTARRRMILSAHNLFKEAKKLL